MPSVAGDALSVAPAPKLWRISDRRTFQALRRRGRRARAGALTVTWLAADAEAPSAPPRAGFVVARNAGGAVVRNRIRRRLRAGLRELAARGELPAGAYLVGATGEAATQPWADLVAALASAVAEATTVPA